MKSFAASAALLLAAAPAAIAQSCPSCGTAQITNNCNYAVSLDNTPAAGNGFNIVSQTLSAGGGSYSQKYQPLNNGNGWSAKLAPISGGDGQIMQFEYTVMPSSISNLWFDISYVNGDPFNGDWDLSSSDEGTCPTTHNAYLNPDDNEHGMQVMCNSGTDITLVLCPGGSSSGSSGASNNDSNPGVVAAAVSSAAPKTKAPPPPPSTTLVTSHTKPPKPSTTEAPPAVLTRLVTQVVTVEVTATARPKHHPREIHQHQHGAMHHHH